MKMMIMAAAAILAMVGPAEINPCGSGAAFAQMSGVQCCKVCRKGKACGDTCIPRDHNCSKGKGCACDG